MQVSELRQLLEAHLAEVGRDSGLDFEAVQALLAQLPALTEGADPAELVALQAVVRALHAAAEGERQRIGAALDVVQKGRRGNRGYGTLKADRKNQRLYRRA